MGGPHPTYVCETCGTTKQFKQRRGIPTPTRCRDCGPVDRSVQPATARIRVPQAVTDHGLCNQVGDRELFYPEKGRSNREAKAICARCPVRRLCLQYALDAHEDWGIWGGTSEQERRALLANRRAA